MTEEIPSHLAEWRSGDNFSILCSEAQDAIQKEAWDNVQLHRLEGLNQGDVVTLRIDGYDRKNPEREFIQNLPCIVDEVDKTNNRIKVKESKHYISLGWYDQTTGIAILNPEEELDKAKERELMPYYGWVIPEKQ